MSGSIDVAGMPPGYIEDIDAMARALIDFVHPGRIPRFRLGPVEVMIIGELTLAPRVCANPEAVAAVEAMRQACPSRNEPTVFMLTVVLVQLGYVHVERVSIAELGLGELVGFPSQGGRA